MTDFFIFIVSAISHVAPSYCGLDCPPLLDARAESIVSENEATLFPFLFPFLFYCFLEMERKVLMNPLEMERKVARLSTC
jgi:hypothetical protein